ncbi:MAG: DNA alkylation repair protein [Nitrososphaera sp.]|nr:DNA alkylation repair protein [Nitrososphaera sp.]
MKTIEKIREDLRNLADPEKALVLQGFFKTGAGEYGEGDVFLGVTVPESRGIAKCYFRSLDFNEIKELLGSEVHEERMVALMILVLKYKTENKEQVVRFYLDNLRHVNNWDLVDLTAPNILGDHLLSKDRSILYELARSGNVWERRVAIVATLHFIRNDDFADTFRIAKILLGDGHDLIHKAAGWMLREVGKRDPAAEEAFLKNNHRKMPRTMLRYAIERFPEKKRKFFLRSREVR